MSDAGWNPRYVNYAKPRKPEERLSIDKDLHPGAHMVDFEVWISRQWTEWRRLNPDATSASDPKVSAAFDAWLDTQPGCPIGGEYS